MPTQPSCERVPEPHLDLVTFSVIFRDAPPGLLDSPALFLLPDALLDGRPANPRSDPLLNWLEGLGQQLLEPPKGRFLVGGL